MSTCNNPDSVPNSCCIENMGDTIGKEADENTEENAKNGVTGAREEMVTEAGNPVDNLAIQVGNSLVFKFDVYHSNSRSHAVTHKSGRSKTKPKTLNAALVIYGDKFRYISCYDSDRLSAFVYAYDNYLSLAGCIPNVRIKKVIGRRKFY